MLKNNYEKNVIVKMATISTVATNVSSILWTIFHLRVEELSNIRHLFSPNSIENIVLYLSIGVKSFSIYFFNLQTL